VLIKGNKLKLNKMTKEDIIKELDKLGNTLYEKYGTDSYLERCTVHDLKTKVKALNISVVLKPLKSKEVKTFEDWYIDNGYYKTVAGNYMKNDGVRFHEVELKYKYKTEYLQTL
jgi:hypothetical protein